MHTVNQIPGRTVSIAGQEWLYFSGTSYLGMACEEAFLDLVKEGLDRYGGHFGGSRTGNLRIGLFREVEDYLAGWTGATAALTVSSGTVAGQLVARYFGRNHRVSYAPGAHPAMWGNAIPPKTLHEKWTADILDELKNTEDPYVLFSNAIDSLYVRPYSFDWLAQLPAEREVTLVLDDSHGIGITGQDGAGIISEIKVPGQVQLVVIASMAKALGIPGGVILGSRYLIDQLWESPFYAGASPGPPPYLYAFLKAKNLYQENRIRLLKNIRYFQERLERENLFRHFDDYPVFCSTQPELAGFLEKNQVMISAFPYPTPDDELLARVVINSRHQETDLARLAELVNRFQPSEAV